MCSCKMVATTPGNWLNDGLEVPTSVRIPEGFLNVGGQWQAITLTPVLLTYASRKRTVKATLTHSFCPFCGAAYGKEVSHG